MGNSKKFIADIEKFGEAVEASSELVKREVARNLFTKIIDRTPIWFLHEDPGGTKGAWRPSNGRPITAFINRKDPSGEAVKKIMEQVIARSKAGKSIYLTNASKHIFVLEDGKFPIGGKGSWNSITQQFEKRSEGGYSTQLKGAGMVKISLSEFEEIVARAVRKYRVKIY